MTTAIAHPVALVKMASAAMEAGIVPAWTIVWISSEPAIVHLRGRAQYLSASRGSQFASRLKIVVGLQFGSMEIDQTRLWFDKRRSLNLLWTVRGKRLAISGCGSGSPVPSPLILPFISPLYLPFNPLQASAGATPFLGVVKESWVSTLATVT
jgi:hypothetical protein